MHAAHADKVKCRDQIYIYMSKIFMDGELINVALSETSHHIIAHI